MTEQQSEKFNKMSETGAPFHEKQPMRALIAAEPLLLMTLSRFNIPLGFGSKSVREVCAQHSIHCPTFLSVANFMAGRQWSLSNVELGPLMEYLKNAHTYFLDFILPIIRRKLLEAIDCSDPDGLGFLILRFYDEYASEVRNHMNGENEKVFPYVEALAKGKIIDEYNIARFAAHHTHIAPKLQELKDIIVRYYPGKGNDLLNSALFDIIMCERDLHTHCLVEDQMFVPAVKACERVVRASLQNAPADDPHNGRMPDSDQARIAELSNREKEVICLIAKGLTNKEIADKLYLSVHTVTTHRRNICNKLEIHSPAGITIFAIVNGLLPLEEIPRPR